jgi:O-antigen ligase/tetratricopeptide (TPR) repeat protein
MKNGATTVKQNTFEFLNTNTILSIVLFVVFLGVNLVQLNGAIDEMGPQWYYLSMMNIAVAIFLFFKNKTYQEAIKTVLSSSFAIIFIIFIAYVGASYLYAINKTEMLVCYARFMTTAMAFFNIAILVQKEPKLIRVIVIILCLGLLADSYYTISHFLNKPIEMTSYDAFVLSIKGNASNKNIWAASIAIKLPFSLYMVYVLESKWKYFFMAIVMMAVMSIIIMSTRSTYVSTFSYALFFIILCVIEIIRKQINYLTIFKLIIPMILGVIFATFAIKTVNNQFEKTNQGNFAALSSRVNSINLEGSGRKDYWLASIDYMNKNKLIGAGFGNWKIAVIPYEREILDDNILSYHIHNDFLEVGAETGIIGFLLYVGLFIWTFVMFCKNYFSKELNENRFLHFFALLSLVGYGVDAFLNFPIERPITQILFAFCCAINLSVYLENRKKKEIKPSSEHGSKSFIFSEITTIVIVLIMLPVAYVTNSTFESMKIQPKVYADLDAKNLSIAEVENLNNYFPNLSATGLAISDIIGTYYVKNGKYEESIPYFTEGKLANPYFHLSDTYKSLAYINLNKDDSALKYGLIGFNERPRSKTAYNQIVNITAKLKDSVGLKKAFLTYIKYRNDEFGWYLYLNNIIRMKQAFTPEIITLVDSACKLFPANTDLKNLQNIYRSGNQIAVQQNTAAIPVNNISEEVNERNKKIGLLITKATYLFNGAKYMDAAKVFLEASVLDPNNYAYYENAGVCYYNNNNLEQCLQYFDKSINLNTSTSGKSEFFKGVALNALGKKEEACRLLQVSEDKKYPDANKYFILYCKNQTKN